MNHLDDSRMKRVDILEKVRLRLAESRRGLAEDGMPIVTLAYSQSVDGCIAPFGGGKLQLSNSTSQRLTHRVRALHDAILVGINTVLCDDPRLTVRLAIGNNPQPIVVDSRLRFPLEAKLLRGTCVPPIIAAGKFACDKKAAALTAAGARVICVPLQEDGLIDLRQLMARLKHMNFHSVMVEGGAKVITSFLTARIADQLLLSIAPRFVGGLRAVNPTHAWEQTPEIDDVQYQLMDGDLIVWGHLKSKAAPRRAQSAYAPMSNGPPK